MGILLCSRTFFAIQGVLYPASIVTNSTSENFSVTWSYTASHATLSLTFPAVTSTPNTIPCLSQAVCASYANCRSCAPFTNIPQSGSVLDTVFSTVPPPELPLFSSSSSSLTFLPSFSRSSDTSLRSCSSYTFAALATCSFWNFFLFVWGDRIFEKCGIRRDEGGDGGKTLEIRGKRRLPARDRGANYQQS